MKRLFSLITVIVLTVTVIAASFTFPGTESEAAAKASALLKASQTEIHKGDSVKVTLTVTSGLTMAFFKYTLVYDAEKLTFIPSDGQDPANGSIKEMIDTQDGKDTTGFTRVFNFVSKDVGTVEFKLKDVMNIALESVEEIETEAGSCTVKITETAKSSNCYLKGISPSVGKLEPAFSKDVTKYTVNVPAGTKVCYLDCAKEDSSASKDLSGDEYLKVGSNVRTCTVTAADGTVKVYTITVVRPADPTPTPTSAPTATPDVSSPTPTGTGSEETASAETNTPEPTATPGLPTETVIGDVKIGENTYKLYNIMSDLQSAHPDLKIIPSSNFLFGTMVLSGLRCYSTGSNTQYVVKAAKDGGPAEYYVFDTADKTIQRYGGDEERLLSAFDIVEGEFIKPTDSEVVPDESFAPENTPASPTPQSSGQTGAYKPADNALFFGIGAVILLIVLALAVIVIVNVNKKS